MEDIRYIQDSFDEQLTMHPLELFMAILHAHEPMVIGAQSQWGYDRLRHLLHMLSIERAQVNVVLLSPGDCVNFVVVQDQDWQSDEMNLWWESLGLLGSMMGSEIRPILKSLMHFPIPEHFNLKDFMGAIEAMVILRSLMEKRSNRVHCAQQLGLKRTTLIEKLKRYNSEANFA